MSATVDFGDVREVWYASLAAPNTKFSFLIRDDAFSKSGAVFGRTVRLGDPLNTGPGSGWRQMTWEGGNGQHDWQDDAMFLEGSADVWSHTGRIRMWPGWQHIHKDATRKFDSFCFGSGNTGPGIGNTKLYIGERDFYYVAAAPSGGYKAYSYDPDTGTITTLPTTPTGLGRGYTAIAPATDDGSSSSYIYFGTGGGLWLYYEPGNTWFQDTGASFPIAYDSMVPFRDALYYCSGSEKSLVKRTPSASFGVVGTHTVVKKHGSAYATQGLAVWNNRLWYGLNFQGNKAMLATSDGVSAQTVVEFPEEFFITKMMAHYGSLFIFGGKAQAVAGNDAHPAAISVVWKYNGSSLTKLWESNDEDHNASTDNKPHIATAVTTFGSLLVWVNPGFDGTVSPRAGLVMWDAEKDAIFEGPALPMDPAGKRDGLAPTAVHAWDNTIVVGYHDFHDYTKNGVVGVDFVNGVSFLRWPNLMRDKNGKNNGSTFKGHSVDSPVAERTQFVLSSRYRGDQSVQTETKTWLAGRVTLRISAPNAKVRIYAVTNERASYLVHTEEYSASDTGWRTVRFPLKSVGEYHVFTPLTEGDQATALDTATSGKYLQSEFVQYRIELVNTAIGDTLNTSTPEVDAIEVAWMVAPTKRRQFHLRHVLTDGQERLSEAANPLTTAQDMADELEALWSENLPFRMWGPFAEAVDPTTLDGTNAIEVVPVVESYNNQQYRVDTTGSAVAQETALTLIENVTS